jgi:outer membrane protein assembly factor BamD
LFRHFSSRAAIVLVLAAALAVTGCNTFKKKKPTLAYEERPVELLYNAGASRMDNRQWAEAVEYFKEVERQHPYSEWARRSILMTAYAHYMANDYAEAISDSDQFIQLYPGNPSTPYAYYLKSICYFEQIVDVGRDQASTSEAGEALREVAKRFPNSEYAADARLKIDMVNDQLAGKEMTVGRYYLRAGDALGSIARFRTVIDKYQTTSHTPEALYRLVEAYLTLGLVGEAKRNAAVLGYNYPGDPWYAAAYNLMASKGFRPDTAPNPAGKRGPHFPFFGHHDKAGTIAPPTDNSTQTAAADSEAADPNAIDTSPANAQAQNQTSGQTPSQTQKPAKQTGFVHGVLGL